MTNERKNITQPSDWWDAFEAEAEKRGLTLAEFMGLAASKMLTKEQRAELSQRVKPGRKKTQD
jgi:ribonuclease HII